MEMAQSERKEKEALKKELEQKINEVEHLRMGKCHLENRFYSSGIFEDDAQKTCNYNWL